MVVVRTITQGVSSKERLGLVFTLVLHCFLLFLHCLTLQQLHLVHMTGNSKSNGRIILSGWTSESSLCDRGGGGGRSGMQVDFPEVTGISNK